MTLWTRRHVLSGITTATVALVGCLGASGDPGFTRSEVTDQELVVEFDEDLEPDAISVVDPDGEGYGETSVATGATRASFDISMPYTPGEYTIIATQDGDHVAETTQEIQPKLEIVDVGVGANRMDEMPEELGNTRESNAIVEVSNTGSGPEVIHHLNLSGDLPNDRDDLEERTGIFDPESGRESTSPVLVESGENRTLFTTTVPFSFHGDGVTCDEESQSGEFIVKLDSGVHDSHTQGFSIEYSGAESYNGCDIDIFQME